MFHRYMNAYVSRLKKDSREQQLAVKRYHTPLTPRMDLQEFGGPNPYVHAYLELPGMDREDIVISIPPGVGVITVFGERKDTFGRVDSEIAANPFHKPGVSIREIKTGRFRRDIPAPRWLGEGQVTAVVSDGVLRLTWPLAQPNNATTRLPSTSNGSSLLFSDPAMPAPRTHGDSEHVAKAEPESGMVRRRSSGEESGSASSTGVEEPRRASSAKMEEDT